MSDGKGINLIVYMNNSGERRSMLSLLRNRSGYHTTVVNKKDGILETAGDSSRRVILTDSPDGLADLENQKDIPKVALIHGDIRKGLKDVVRNNLGFFLIGPYSGKDLNDRIRAALKYRSWFQKLYDEGKDLEAIIEVTFLVSSTLDPKEVLFFIVSKLSEIIEVARCSIISIGYSEKRYADVISSYEDPGINHLRIDLRKYPEIMKALRAKRPIIIRDAMVDQLMKPVRPLIAPLGIRSIAVLPIIHKDEVIGTLFLRTSRKKRGFTKRDIEMSCAIANLSANALYNAFLFERLEKEKVQVEKLAITDYLTGINNIRYFYYRLDEEFSRAKRYNGSISCIMFDIDHFKRINDRYGHRTGDSVLRQFAQLIRKHIRRSDILARYGGEEFIMLLPHTSVEGAAKEAKRLRASIKGKVFKGVEKELITFSMGISCWPHHNINTPDDLITLADNALFRAKQAGRDSIMISDRVNKEADS